MLISSDPASDFPRLDRIGDDDPGWPPSSDESVADDPVYIRLVELKQMPRGWDGDDACSIRGEILQTAWDFIQAIQPDFSGPFAIVPLSSGTIELEWAQGNRILQIEFETSDTIHYLKWDSDREMKDEGFFPSDDMTKARSMLQWFASRT
jgi:hypothetical protein